MKPRRTTTNRRKSGGTPARHRLLEVKVRTESVKRQRRRKAGGLLWKISLAVIFIALMGAGGRIAVRKFLFQNPEYSLKNLDAHLDGTMNREELIQLTGFEPGKNMFLLDLDHANSVLSGLPEVRRATVERILPDTVKVSIERRPPIFLFPVADESSESFFQGKSFLCDGDGIMMQPSRLDPEFLKLPVIKGVDLSSAIPGKKLDDKSLAFAIELHRALSAIPEESFKISTIDVSKPYAAVVTDSSGAKFTFGTSDLPSQMDRLRKLLTHCQETGRRLQTANLMILRNTPVTFLLSPEDRSGKILPVGTTKPKPHQ